MGTIQNEKRNWSESSLGIYNIEALMQESNGLISYKIFDSGVSREGKASYSIASKDDKSLEVYPSDKPDHKITLPRKLNITPHFIIFAGLYLGDGSKAGGRFGPVSFSQREPNLANFMRKEFQRLFGDSVKFIHRVGEDGLFFLSEDNIEKLLSRVSERESKKLKDVFETSLDDLLTKVSATTKTAITKYKSKRNLITRFGNLLPKFILLRPLMEEYLEELKRREFQELGFELGENDEIKVNIRLPGVKGSRVVGKSSRSDELDVMGANYFRPILFKILEDIEESIVKNIKDLNHKLVWNFPPAKNHRLRLNLMKYLKESPSATYKTTHGLKKYKVDRKASILKVKKATGKVFSVPNILELSPLVCLFIGLYFAEGHTTKSKLFVFSKTKVSGLNIGFTGSENNTLTIFVRAMEKLLTKPKVVLDYWRLKIGSKYFSEVATLGLKEGVPVLRRGNKGQGAASSLELMSLLRKWAEDTMPILKEISNFFDHVEFTGAGIPRVDIFYKNSPAIMLFAIMSDAVARPELLSKYLDG